MPRVQPLEIDRAEGKAKELLEKVKAKLGRVPNMMATAAHAPGVLEAYLSFSSAMNHSLDGKERELIALAVAEENGCEYCAAAHTLLGRKAGLTAEEVAEARRGRGTTPRSQAIVSLALAIAANRGKVSDAQFAAAKEAGLSDAEIVAIVGVVSLNVFTNYINSALGVETDFPAVEPVEREKMQR